MHATIVISALIVLLQGVNSASLKNSTKTVTPINDDDDAKSDCGSKYRSADEETRIRCINYEDLVSMKAKLANDDLKDDKGIEESDGFDFDDDSDDEYFDEDTDANDNEDSESKDDDGDSDDEEDDEEEESDDEDEDDDEEESDDEDEGANSASLKNSTKTVTPINDHDAKSDCGSKYRSADEETRIRCITYDDLVSMKAKLANDDLKDDKGIEESDGFDFDDDSDDEYFDEDTDADDNEDSESKNDDGDSDDEEDDKEEESDDEDDDEEESDYEDEGANSASLKNSTKTVTPINDHDAKSDCGSKYRSADEKTRIRCISYEDLVSMKAKLANDDLKDNKGIEEDDDEEESDDENEDDDEEESDDEDEDDDDIFGGWSMKKMVAVDPLKENSVTIIGNSSILHACVAYSF